jgi:hypothetical protein
MTLMALIDVVHPDRMYPKQAMKVNRQKYNRMCSQQGGGRPSGDAATYGSARLSDQVWRTHLLASNGKEMADMFAWKCEQTARVWVKRLSHPNLR